MSTHGYPPNVDTVNVQTWDDIISVFNRLRHSDGSSGVQANFWNYQFER